MKIAVLMGGTSAERDVSLATGREIARALRRNGHDVIAIDAANGRLLESEEATRELPAEVGRTPPARDELNHISGGRSAADLGAMPEIRETQAVFVALHGGAGEDGRIQALLDLVGVPYTGSGCLGSALAMDKLVSKQLFSQADIPTPPWRVAPVGPPDIEAEFGGYPVVVKPSREGSTVGISVVRSSERLEAAIAEAAAFDGPVLIERFIAGRELAVGVLGDEALPVVEIRPTHEIYDYECKYTHGKSAYEVPAPISAQLTERVQTLAVDVHRTLRLSGYSRIDLRLDEDGRPWCLEANSLPGMTPTSLLPKAAAAAGTPFDELCERIVEIALEGDTGLGTRRGGRG